MKRTIFLRVVLCTALVLLATALAGRSGVGQEETTKAPPAPAKKAKKFRGRLPAYYRHVVDQKQREAIYKIQEEYAPKVAALRAQLAAVIKERDEKVAALLAPEQLKKVEDLRAAARAKQSQKKPATNKPAAETPSTE